MSKNHFLAGPGRALLLDGNNLIGVAKVLQESGLSLSTTAEEIRGGQGNMLYGQYFHDSNMTGTLTDAMFNIDYMAASLGTTVTSGGISVKEEEVIVPEMGGKVTLTETPVAFEGTMIGWYKKPSENEWQIGTISEKSMTISSAKPSEHYCVKYFWNNENAKSITIKANYVPKTLHLVLINNLFAGDIEDVGGSEKYGRIITDIPRFQLDGAQDLSLTASGAATTSLAGKALAVNNGENCEEEPYYGTMTQEIFGAKWQDDVIALAVEGGDIELATEGSETLAVRVVFGNNMASIRKPNSNFTFTVEEEGKTATNLQVGAHDGIINAGSMRGKGIISVKLNNSSIDPTFVRVTVS